MVARLCRKQLVGRRYSQATAREHTISGHNLRIWIHEGRPYLDLVVYLLIAAANAVCTHSAELDRTGASILNLRCARSSPGSSPPSLERLIIQELASDEGAPDHVVRPA